jgi:RecA-family ATPase
MEPRKFTIEPLVLPATEPKLRPPIVHGLLRRGEVCNWIAAPKTGKTWMVYSLLSSIVRGAVWCGHKCEPGRVLLIDNELHPETAMNRLWRVAYQDGLDTQHLARMVDVAFIRGARGSVEDLEATMRDAGRGAYNLVIIDAFYRFIPAGSDENSNSDMTALYNHIDQIAGLSEAATILVHHSTKGSQSGKETMDVGAGAGSIGRATDSHVVFLRHETEGCVTMQARCRSWAPVAPKVLHVDSVTPRVWHDAHDGLDPSDLWNPAPPKKKAKPAD